MELSTLPKGQFRCDVTKSRTAGGDCYYSNALVTATHYLGFLDFLHKLIRIFSPFSNPYGQCKSSVKTGEANSGLLCPPLSTALLDMLGLQHKLESKAMKLYATIDVTNAGMVLICFRG